MSPAHLITAPAHPHNCPCPPASDCLLAVYPALFHSTSEPDAGPKTNRKCYIQDTFPRFVHADAVPRAAALLIFSHADDSLETDNVVEKGLEKQDSSMTKRWGRKKFGGEEREEEEKKKKRRE